MSRRDNTRRSKKRSLAKQFSLALSVVSFAAGFSQPAMVSAGESPTLQEYWKLPLAPQGEAPAQWSEFERSLAPEACAECHADKYEEWRSSLHAHAFSPGLVGQLLTYDAQQTASCMSCHAPLAEQRQAFEDARAAGDADTPAGQGLAAVGNSCGGCHLRNHQRYGPPQRDTGAIGQSEDASAHGGVYRTSFFESSEFCAVCHQFPADYAINGKPLENTYVEWQASPQSAEGIGCQSCHMPDRKHLWRGIHDPEMVAAGLTPRFEADAEAVTFELTNIAVGHAFPTYVTPKVVMRAVALDPDGNPRPETAVSHVIQRSVGFAAGQWVEYSDTRLLPGQTASIRLPWQGSDRARAWLEVEPDDYYRVQVYRPLMKQLPEGEAAARLIAAAAARAEVSGYRLFETEVTRPAAELP